MNRRRFSQFMWLALATAVLFSGIGLTSASGAPLCGSNGTNPGACSGFNPNVNYTIPNFANSPNIRKFVDSLPGLGAANANNLGQYIPIATPDTTTFPGSDYYEIGVAQYQRKMHSDLPPTMLRGYYQINGPDNSKQYLGAAIIAHRDRAVRFKVHNQLGAGATGNLPLPVDPTVMGAGLGPNGVGAGNYEQNRITVHLHGGLTPWISDGTPHQWVTPTGDASSVYNKGASFKNVPDMFTGTFNGDTGTCIAPGTACFTPTATDGIGTYYYSNQQSGRLMFYHDHAYGITRLNVYAGLAAPLLLVDQVEEDLISGTNVSGANPNNMKVLPDLGGVYHYGIPLVIQDRTFVNDATTPPGAGFSGTPTPKTLTVDPLWATHTGIGARPAQDGGNFWFAHEYMPNEDIYSSTGFNPLGRWDYGPFLIPGATVANRTLPSPTTIPESYQDTMIVNGTAFPYLKLPPTAVRFRILNACNDRMLNLQLYYAATANGVLCVGPNAPDQKLCTEVSMVPAAPNAAFPTWPTDGRPGGVPDPTTQGPHIIQIGAEGGFLVAPADIPPQPVDFDYNRRSITFGDVLSTSHLLGPAFRSDIIVDFSSVPSGSTLILYNDAPAPMPGHDDRNDYFTNSPDQTAVGGAPSGTAGFGPNTRTVMQIRINGTATPAYNLANLQAALPKAFAVDQEPPIVPLTAFAPAYIGSGRAFADTFSNATQDSLNISGTREPVSKVIATLPGLNYTTPPTLSFLGSDGSGAAATAMLNPFGGIAILTAGAGCTTPPTVTLGAPDDPTVANRVQALAEATISGGVLSSVSVTEPGAGYITNATPTVTFSGGCTTVPTGQGSISLGSIGHINVTSGGSYIQAPQVTLAGGGGGTGGGAIAMLLGDLPMTGKNLTEGTDMDYGRMNVLLGSTPSALSPNVGAGPVVGIAFYIDPPTEILNAGEPILWRITHLGADSHAMHFHLFNLQVVNRVDYTNTVKPPYPDELGWREVIRTNPFEDLIVAIKPVSMALPFSIPRSSRLLDVTFPPGPDSNFLPVAPPVGVPAVSQTQNVITDFGWEYVWHCHLLGHEENDMMRPMVFQPPTTAPTGTLVLAAPAVSAQYSAITLNWTDTDVTNFPGRVAGYRIQRCTGATCVPSTSTVLAYTNRLTYVDTSVAPIGTTSTTYRYNITAVNDAGSSASPSATVTAVIPVATALTTAPTPVSPTGNGVGTNAPFVFSAVSLATGYRVTLTDTTTGVISPVVVFTSAQAGCASGTGNCSFTMAVSPLVLGNNYTWTVAATNAAGTGPSSAPTAFFVSQLPSSGTKIGVFRNGTWYLDSNGDGAFDAGDATLHFGAAGDIPVTGDWTGSGRSKIGVYRNGTWYLDSNGDGAFDAGDATLSFGAPGDIPVTGDWTGTGTTKIGVYRNGTWYLDVNGNGVFDAADSTKSFGTAGDIPVTGDWTSTGTTKIGIFRPSTGQWFLDLTGTGTFVACGASDACYSFGVSTDVPVTGAW